MQDSETGEIKPLDPKWFKEIPTVPGTNAFADSRELREAFQKACDEVQPDRTKQGPVFVVGEVLEIRGGKFQVTKIEPGYLKLKSLPSR